MIVTFVCVCCIPQALGAHAGSRAAKAPSAQPAAAIPNVLGGGVSTARSSVSGRNSDSSAAAASLVLQDSAASPLDQIMLAAARWVAHLPYVGHSWLGKQQQSRPWAVHADVVGMAAGGEEEHAHLLAGFFMQLGQQVRPRALTLEFKSSQCVMPAIIPGTECACMQELKPWWLSTKAAAGHLVNPLFADVGWCFLCLYLL